MRKEDKNTSVVWFVVSAVVVLCVVGLIALGAFFAEPFADRRGAVEHVADEMTATIATNDIEYDPSIIASQDEMNERSPMYLEFLDENGDK